MKLKKLKFTPLEFETDIYKNASHSFLFVKIYSVGVWNRSCLDRRRASVLG